MMCACGGQKWDGRVRHTIDACADFRRNCKAFPQVVCVAFARACALLVGNGMRLKVSNLWLELGGLESGVRLRSAWDLFTGVRSCVRSHYASGLFTMSDSQQASMTCEAQKYFQKASQHASIY